MAEREKTREVFGSPVFFVQAMLEPPAVAAVCHGPIFFRSPNASTRQAMSRWGTSRNHDAAFNAYDENQHVCFNHLYITMYHLIHTVVPTLYFNFDFYILLSSDIMIIIFVVYQIIRYQIQYVVVPSTCWCPPTPEIFDGGCVGLRRSSSTNRKTGTNWWPVSSSIDNSTLILMIPV